MREPGALIDDKYEVVESLGQGGMGEVYLVRHLHLEELRVVKILRQDLATDETAQKRFLREARLATQIKHPNVAILYDFAQLPAGSFYMVWEHIEGQDVGTWLEEKGRLPLLPALELGIQGLRGLEAIHASGVVHRDISPDNLMISRDRRGRYLVKIIDLGLAKNLVADPNFEVTQVGMFMGKLKYCSPEQAEVSEGERVDSRSDLYSFGLVLYEMIAGEPPFEAANPHAAVMKRLQEDPIPLTERNPDLEVPPELDRVLRRALARRPEGRFPDAVSFIQALEPVTFSLRQDGGEASKRRAPMAVDIPRADRAPRPEGERQGDTHGRHRESSQLSKAERDELLAQIERAAKRKERKDETTQVMHKADVLITEGNLEEARILVRAVEESAPGAAGLPRLQRRLRELEARAAGPEGEAEPPQASLPSTGGAPREDQPAGYRQYETRDLSGEEGEAVEARAALGEERQGVQPQRGEAPKDEAEVEAGGGGGREGGGSEGEGEPEAKEPQPPERTPRGPTTDRVRELEGMIESYIQKGQLQLAEMARDTLVELAPTHPKRTDYEQWIDILRDELEQDRKAQAALEAGREALRQGRYKAARKRLAELERQDRKGDLTETFRKELEEAQQEERRSEDLEERRGAFEEHLAAGKLEEAEGELDRLARLGASRLTLDLMRQKLEEKRQKSRNREQLGRLQARFDQRLEAGDWGGARELAHEVARLEPEGRRAVEMYRKVGQLEEGARRRQALQQGVEQVESLIEAAEPEQARLALQVLQRMELDEGRRKQLEQKIAQLEG